MTRHPPHRPSAPRHQGGFAGVQPGTRYAAHRAGLPSALGTDAYSNIEAGLQAIEQRRQLRAGLIEPEQTPEPAVVKEVRGPRVVRVASLKDLPSSLKSLGGGFYRHGHVIWELRAAEDEVGGYVLTRKREEQAVDMRGKTASAPVMEKIAEEEDVVVGKCPSCLWVGQKVAFIHQGQVLPVIVIEITDGGTEATVEDEVGQQMQAPMELIVTDMTVQAPTPSGAPAPVAAPVAPVAAPAVLGAPVGAPAMATPQAPAQAAPAQAPHGCDCDRGCQCPCHGGKGKKKGPVQGMEPKVEPSSKDTDAQPAADDSGDDAPSSDPDPVSEKVAARNLAFLIRADDSSLASGMPDTVGMIGKWVEPKVEFKPQYMGGQVTLKPGTQYMVDGSSRADPKIDRTERIPNPIIPYPNVSSANWPLNDRVRLTPKGGGDTIYVSPMDLHRHFDVAGQGYAPQVPHNDPYHSNEDRLPRAPTMDTRTAPDDRGLTGYEPTKIRQPTGAPGARPQTPVNNENTIPDAGARNMSVTPRRVPLPR